MIREYQIRWFYLSTQATETLISIPTTSCTRAAESLYLYLTLNARSHRCPFITLFFHASALSRHSSRLVPQIQIQGLQQVTSPTPLPTFLIPALGHLNWLRPPLPWAELFLFRTVASFQSSGESENFSGTMCKAFMCFKSIIWGILNKADGLADYPRRVHDGLEAPHLTG